MSLSRRPSVPHSDSEIVARVRAGDSAAFEELFRTHGVAMLRFAASFVGDVDTAEEIVQEVFGRIWLHHTEWQPSTDVLSYLLAAVRNRALDTVTTEQRRAARTQRFFQPGEAPTMSPAARPDSHIEITSQQAKIWGTAQTLPEQQRTVLSLRWRSLLEWEEVAQIMGISIAAARMTHSRAIQTLREKLQNILP